MMIQMGEGAGAVTEEKVRLKRRAPEEKEENFTISSDDSCPRQQIVNRASCAGMEDGSDRNICECEDPCTRRCKRHVEAR